MKTYFHGTNKENVESILRDGLRTDFAGRTYDRTPTGCIFLSATRREARRYAEAGFGRRDATVVTVTLPDDWQLTEDPTYFGIISRQSIPPTMLEHKVHRSGRLITEDDIDDIGLELCKAKYDHKNKSKLTADMLNKLIQQRLPKSN